MGGLPDLETRAADLLAVLDAAGQRRPTLLASADGGMVAALLAATHPDRVAGLVWFFAQARSVKTHGWPFGRDPDDVDRLAKEAERAWGTRTSARMYSHAEWTTKSSVPRQDAAARVGPRRRSGSSDCCTTTSHESLRRSDPVWPSGRRGIRGSGSSSRPGRPRSDYGRGLWARAREGSRLERRSSNDVRLCGSARPGVDSILSTVCHDIVGRSRQAEFGATRGRNSCSFADRADDADGGVVGENDTAGDGSTPRSTARARDPLRAGGGRTGPRSGDRDPGRCAYGGM